jgi:Cd2+/Zn2+-exporting ATPase
MENKIAALPQVASCTLTYATKQLRVEAVEPLKLLPEIQSICASVESAVQVTPRTSQRPAKSQQKEEGGDHKELTRILIGAGTLVLGKVLELLLPATAPLSCNIAALLVYVVGYLLCGAGVLKEAALNLSKGRALDENFLMGIATLGAFAIGEYPEALGVMLFYRVGEYFEDRAVEKSRSNIMDALDLRPEVVHLIDGDQVRTIPAEDALPGDVVQVRPGDRIPLDGVVLEGESFLDTSAITGEPVPISVHPGDNVTSGCVNQSGVLKMRVEKELSQSMVTRILDSVENAAAAKPHIDRFISRFCRIYTPCVVLLAALTALVPSLITGNWIYWIKTGLTFLVISCPCALVLSVPLAFFAGIGLGSKKNILFKGGSAMEAICKVKAVVMDKTGTITQGVFSVQQVRPADGVTEQELLELAATCESASTHPIGQSIRRAAQEQGLTLRQPDKIVEIAGQGLEADGVLCGNRKLLEGRGVALPADLDAVGTEVLLARDGRYLGCILISDAVKPESKPAIDALHRQGIKTAMLTGDALDSAQAVAKETGVDEVFAKLLPQEKLERLQTVREKYGPVMFVGDGINDAPVLAGADVGAAMGSGADAAIEAADVVFMTSRMDAVPDAIAIGRLSTRVGHQNVVIALAVKLLVIVLGLFGFANMWAAVFADTGVAMVCILNSIRILYHKS